MFADCGNDSCLDLVLEVFYNLVEKWDLHRNKTVTFADTRAALLERMQHHPMGYRDMMEPGDCILVMEQLFPTRRIKCSPCPWVLCLRHHRDRVPLYMSSPKLSDDGWWESDCRRLITDGNS
ncbi:Ff.00g065760.m01.CDS01 [Fusarium sp. VM40]|nr:Ff.00g065760.m01.CDS01 [Fusarium sp. VM40]